MKNLIKKTGSFFNPERFQGWGKKSNYFEGWYFKLTDPSLKFAYAIIPGIAMDGIGNKHAFIQVLEGRNHTSAYHRFDFNDFVSASGKFEISIGSNHFSENKLVLDLPDLKGELNFTGNVPWPKPFYSPGIMGPFSFIPFMECYHGIVSMDHQISGFLKSGTKTIDFTNGRGYIEKDWGHSFPSAYVWMQSNHFSKPGVSIKASVAKIPWIGSSFTGFIAGLWLNKKLIRFTTYNGTKLIVLNVSIEKVSIILKNRRYTLEIEALRKEAAGLASPIGGFMNGRIEESMAAEITVRLIKTKTGEVIFNDTGFLAGLEVAGKIEEIITG